MSVFSDGAFLPNAPSLFNAPQDQNYGNLNLNVVHVAPVVLPSSSHAPPIAAEPISYFSHTFTPSHRIGSAYVPPIYNDETVPPNESKSQKRARLAAEARLPKPSTSTLSLHIQAMAAAAGDICYEPGFDSKIDKHVNFFRIFSFLNICHLEVVFHFQVCYESCSQIICCTS